MTAPGQPPGRPPQLPAGRAPVSGAAPASGSVGPASGLGVNTRPGSSPAGAVSGTPASSPVSSPASRGTVYGRGLRPVRPTDPDINLGTPATAQPPTHGLAVAELDRLEFPVDAAGVLLGADVETKPVVVRLFREQSTRLTLIGGLWITRVVLFRTLAVGARIVIQTQRPEAWRDWGRWATGDPERVQVVPAAEAAMVGGSAAAPGLVVNDTGTSPRTVAPALGTWQTQLTVLPELSAYGFGAVGESDLVMMQRLSPVEASAARAVLRLTPHTAGLMQAMRDDMLALLGGGADRYLWMNATKIEQDAFGPPRRGD